MDGCKCTKEMAVMFRWFIVTVNAEKLFSEKETFFSMPQDGFLTFVLY